MGKTGSTDIKVHEQQAPLANPDDMAELFGEFAGEGLENITAAEITLPQAKIMQSNSVAVADGKARQGEIMNSMSEEVYGTSMKFVPLFFYISRIHFNGQEITSGIECTSRNGITGSRDDDMHGGGKCLACPFSKWTPVPGAPDKGPECIEFKNILAIPITDDSGIQNSAPVVIGGKRKAISAINKFLTSADLIRVGGKRVPFFGSTWIVTTKQVKNAKGTFFIPEFKRDQFIADREILLYLRNMYQGMKASQEQFVVHEQASDDDEVEAPADGNGEY